MCSFLCALGASQPVFAEASLGLDRFQAELKNHPQFSQAELDREIADLQWAKANNVDSAQLQAQPFFNWEEPVGASAFLPNSSLLAGNELSLRKTFSQTGTQTSLNYRYSYADQQFPQISLPGIPSGFEVGLAQFHQHVAYLQLSQSLLRNFDGYLSRLGLELAKDKKNSQRLQSLEQQEAFLLKWSALFTQACFYQKRAAIATRRLQLAKAQAEQTQKQRTMGLTEKVDTLEAQAAVAQAKQNLEQKREDLRQLLIQIQEARQGSGVEAVSPNTQLSLGCGFSPKSSQALVNQSEDSLKHAFQQSRSYRQIDYRLAALNKQVRAVQRQARPQLQLSAQAGVQSGAANWSDSAGFERGLLGLNALFQMYLGPNPDKKEAKVASLQKKQAQNQLVQIRQNWLESVKRNRSRTESLRRNLVQARRTEKLQNEKVREERRQYLNGRRALSFLIQSQDAQQQAQETVAAYETQLWANQLERQALWDQLLPENQ